MATAAEIAAQIRGEHAAITGGSSPQSGEKEEGKETRAASPIRDTSMAGTAQNRIAQMMTFGTADNIASAVNAAIVSPFSERTFGEVYNDTQRSQQQMADAQQEAHPAVANTASVVGAFAGPNLMSKLGAAKTLMGGAGRGALTGAVNSAAQAAGEADDQGVWGKVKAAADGFVWGGLIGGPLGMAGRSLSRAAQRRADLRLKKNMNTMVQETDAAYKAAHASREVIPGNVVQSRFQTAVQGIRNTAGYSPTLKQNRGIEKLIKDINKETTIKTPTGVQPRDYDVAKMDKLQQDAWLTYHDASPGAKRHVRSIILSLDKALDDAAAVGSPRLKAARSAYRRQRNTQMFEDVMEKAERGAQSGSGDYASRYKNAANTILSSQKYNWQLNDAEKAAVQAIVDGTTPGNVSRYLGKFAPTGGNMASVVGMMGMYYNPAVAVPAMMGSTIARAASNASSKGQVEEARRVLSGSPLAPPTGAENAGPAMSAAGGKIVASPEMPSLIGAIAPGMMPPPPPAEPGSAQSLIDQIIQDRLAQ